MVCGETSSSIFAAFARAGLMAMMPPERASFCTGSWGLLHQAASGLWDQVARRPRR